MKCVRKWHIENEAQIAPKKEQNGTNDVETSEFMIFGAQTLNGCSAEI